MNSSLWSESDLKNQAADGIEESIAWHTVGIVADEPRCIGTGTAVLWHGRSLILTAWHVIKDNPLEDLWFFFRPDGTFDRNIPEEAARQGKLKLTPRTRVEIRKDYSDQVNDIAALEVPARLEETHNLRFHQFDSNAATPEIGTTVAMMGYPEDITRFVGKNRKVVFPSFEWSHRVERKATLKDFNPSSRFLIGYPSAAAGRHPAGFSGCGIWFRGRTPLLWHPNLKLAGICTGYYARSRVLEAVKIESVSAFLKSFIL